MKKIAAYLSAIAMVLGILIIDTAAAQCPAPSLKIALVHFSVAYKQPDQNLAALKELHRRAAREGARIIFNTELALSGYSFSSRDDVAPFSQTLSGSAVQEMAALAKELHVFIGITFPEQDPDTHSYYNAAVVLSPEGKVVCRYHKIYGEKRWARPGNPFQEGVFDTPWGRVGVAVCADSYFGLIPRTLALKGADLLWVPANWPPTGMISPLDVWRTRALENGIYVAACNRTGKDRVMDCTKAVSAVIAPDGTVMQKVVSEESALVFADIPLTSERIDSSKRKERMRSRKVNFYRKIYLDPWTENLTAYYQLPKTGNVAVHCLVPEDGPLDIKMVENRVKKEKTDLSHLWVLPKIRPGRLDLSKLKNLAKQNNAAFALSFEGDEAMHPPLLVTAKGEIPFIETGNADGFPFKRVQFGPAALVLVPMEAFRHPELGIVLAKLGCDMVLLSESDLTESDIRIAAVRTIDNLAVAAVSRENAFIGHMKGVHGEVKTSRLTGPGVCSFDLDTAETRKKEFYDRVDFDVLLKATLNSLLSYIRFPDCPHDLLP